MLGEIRLTGETKEGAKVSLLAAEEWLKKLEIIKGGGFFGTICTFAL
jgi:hypothetical protein